MLTKDKPQILHFFEKMYLKCDLLIVSVFKWTIIRCCAVYIDQHLFLISCHSSALKLQRFERPHRFKSKQKATFIYKSNDRTNNP